MSPHRLRVASRRRFLQFLAASPLIGQGAAAALAQGLPARPADAMVWAPRDLDAVITDPKNALDVFDFEPVAKKNLPPGHFGVMVTGADDEVTLRANREGFQKFQLRPRRLVDVSKIDMATELCGARYDSPIVIAPTGGNHAFHPEGEIAVAKAAKAGNHLQMLATGPAPRSRTRSRRAARRCGFSSIRPTNGTSPRHWSGGRNGRDRRSSP
jgi:hypothetical protein